MHTIDFQVHDCGFLTAMLEQWSFCINDTNKPHWYSQADVTIVVFLFCQTFDYKNYKTHSLQMNK